MSGQEEVVGILLAGGASSRFPGGKLEARIPAALAERFGRPELADRQLIEAARIAMLEAVGGAILLGIEPPDRRPFEGPAAALSDLIAGDALASLSDATRVVIAAADAPFVPSALLGLMAAARGTVVVADDEPLPLAADLGALRRLAARGEIPRLRDLAVALDARALDPRLVARLDPLGGALADIDTPEDLAR